MATPATERVAAYKADVSRLLQEFFASGDAAEAVASLAALEHPLYAHYFVKRAVRRRARAPQTTTA